ncbi:MAG: M24 family metallopeptidase [Dehalococcoidia bacterium]|nr:M24 family metallopeptidase [Dehalococcoidia bacterium]
MTEFAARRRRLMRLMGRGSAAVLVSGNQATRNGDVDYPFRQDSTFYYLTGFEEPNAVAVLRPGHAEPFVLFVRPHDPEQAIWVGPRAGVEGARARYGANAAFPIAELDEQLPGLLSSATTLYFPLGADERPAVDRGAVEPLISRIVARRRGAAQRGLAPLVALRDPLPLVDAMRVVKSRAEIAALQRAIDATGAGLRAAMRATRPGMHEYEVQAILEAEYRRAGSPRDGFPTIAAAGEHACTLHYTANRARIQDGDLVLLDTGAEVDSYGADVTRTFPANGRFTAAQRDVYEIVLAAQAAGIARVRPGVTFHSVHDAALKVLVRGLIDLRILRGDVQGNIERDAYRPYFMHGTSHWLGLDVHDAGIYRANGKSTTLVSGMVLTVEPGLYLATGAPRVPKRLQGIGVRIEDDVLVTPSGRRNLSARIPSAPADLEALVGRG